ncbi:MAG: two-component sensor histidine kinase [FCB group bacterium]|nr:two-component sensor histidine kinase [FCB group bacterium]
MNDQTQHAVPPQSEQQSSLPRYRRLRRNLIIVPFLAALVPLLIMAIINYYQDYNAYKSENYFTVSHLLSNSKRSLQFAVEQRRAVLSLIARGQSLDDLSDDARLMAILRDLKESFGDFVDLGLIEYEGNQSYYAGPYDLKGINYKDQSWFHEVSLRGTYVSDVFMGYRKFPHFVIAFARELENGKFYVLRATIDTRLLNRQIYALESSEPVDIFITNKTGVLQTASTFYGDVLDTFNLKFPSHILDREIIDERTLSDGLNVTMGVASIDDSPFVLVAMLQHRSAFLHWISKRSDVVWFLLASMIGILVTVSLRSKYIVSRLQESDTRRAKTLHNIEYTNKMATLGRLSAGVAHEINNPLAIINEKAGLIKDIASHQPDFPKKERVMDLVDSVTSSVERCSRVTHRLLGFGRRMEFRKEHIDMETLINDVLDFQRSEASHRNIKIDLNTESDISTIQSDRGQLQQVFLNLINNAYAALDDNGKIDINIRQLNADEVEVAISDNGVGIDKKDLDHIFEPFFSTKGESGTGLGLSITKDIIEKLGGIIVVSSRVGKGTCFTVNLPVERLG